MSRPGADEGCCAQHPFPPEQPASPQQPARAQDRSAGQPGHEEATPEEPGGRPRRRGHRRVVSPPTNPGTQEVDDTLVPAVDDPGGAGEGARDAWIRAQRPPHWG